MNTQKRLAIAVMVASWVLAMAVAPVRADSLFNVSVSTTSLMSNSSGPFQIDFQLIDGSGTGDANNTATVTGFNFGGGALLGAPTNIGGVTGDLSSTVTLVDSGFFNNFQQSFTAGSTFSFMVDLTTNLDAGGTPDAFTFALLDNLGNNISTADPGGSLLTVNLNSATPTVTTFAGTGNYATVSATVTTPEPGTLTLLGTGITGGLIALGRRRRRK
jgi:hypothetical protein